MDFSANGTAGPAPLTVSFTDLSSDNPTGWAWFFGDETYNRSWTQVNASAGWGGRNWHNTVTTPDGSIILIGGVGSQGDILRSGDKGKTWTRVNASAGWSSRYLFSSVVMPDGSIVVLGGNSGWMGVNDVWRSTDTGSTWTRQTAAAQWSVRDSHTSVAMPDGSIILMGGFDGETAMDMNDVWKSTDNGVTWTLANASAGWSGREGHTAVVMPDGSIILLGGMDTYGERNDVWRSTDDGTTWSQVNSSAGWPGRFRFASNVMPDSSIVLMGGSSGGLGLNDTWRSTDYGATWTRLPDAGWATRSGQSSAVMRDGTIVLTGGLVEPDLSSPDDVWQFNPAGSSEQNPSHTYREPGIYQVALQAYNASGYSSIRKTGYITVLDPAPTVTGITPSKGSNTTSVAITNLAGTHFNTTIAPFVKLNRTGSADIIATDVAVVNSTRITCLFDLTGHPAGLWNVVVTNPDSQEGILPNGFTIFAPATTRIPTTEPASIPDDDNSGDSVPAIELPSVTNTVNAGGSSAVSHVIITGTGISEFIVTGIVKPRPDDGPYPPGIVYQYVDLVPARFKTITGAEIFFSVPQSWLDQHRISPTNITLYHLTGKIWVALPTEVLETKDGKVFFSATSDGFSLFAIGGTAGNATQVTVSTSQKTADNPVQDQTPVRTTGTLVTSRTTAAPAIPANPSVPSPLMDVIPVIAAAVVLAAGTFLIRRWWIRRQNPALFEEFD